MKIRFNRPWRNYVVGDTCDTLEPGVAGTLVERGIAAVVEEKQVKSPPKDKAMRRAANK